MKFLKNLLGNIVAVIYFICPMFFVLLILTFMPIAFLSDVSTVIVSGFSGQNIAAACISLCGLPISLSLLIPPLRKMYRVLPWLYPLTKIFYINLIILCAGLAILNFGYKVQNNTRHITFFILMIVQIFICRIAMCIYFKLKPVRYSEER